LKIDPGMPLNLPMSGDQIKLKKPEQQNGLQGDNRQHPAFLVGPIREHTHEHGQQCARQAQ
jgi:hypothetical protein